MNLEKGAWITLSEMINRDSFGKSNLPMHLVENYTINVF